MVRVSEFIHFCDFCRRLPTTVQEVSECGHIYSAIRDERIKARHPATCRNLSDGFYVVTTVKAGFWHLNNTIQKEYHKIQQMGWNVFIQVYLFLGLKNVILLPNQSKCLPFSQYQVGFPHLWMEDNWLKEDKKLSLQSNYFYSFRQRTMRGYN